MMNHLMLCGHRLSKTKEIILITEDNQKLIVNADIARESTTLEDYLFVPSLQTRQVQLQGIDTDTMVSLISIMQKLPEWRKEIEDQGLDEYTESGSRLGYRAAEELKIRQYSFEKLKKIHQAARLLHIEPIQEGITQLLQDSGTGSE